MKPEADTLNESPSEKEGKSLHDTADGKIILTLNESPSEKEGKSLTEEEAQPVLVPSMKVPPKRKGNEVVFPGLMDVAKPQ